MSSVTITYARAFTDVVFDKGLSASKILEELHSIARMLQENSMLRQVWENPSIPTEQKRNLLDAIAREEGISRPVRNFMAVLIDHRRIRFVDQILKEFEKELNGRLGFAEAEVTSARDLNEVERRDLESQISRLLGQKVKAHYQQDKSILGGAIVKVGSTIYDVSVRGQLQKVREKLVRS